MPDEPEDPKYDEPVETSVRSDRQTNTVIAKSQENSDRPAHTLIAEAADETDRPSTTTVALGQVKSAEEAKKRAAPPKSSTQSPKAAQTQAKEALKVTQETAPQPSDTVAFISTAEEPQPFPLIVGPRGEERIDGVWDHARKKIIWYVPQELVERTNRHFQVQHGRIMQVK